jgi:hypothetical protein
MPDPPTSSLFTRFVLENPWPLGTVAIVAAVLLIWTGLREGFMRRVNVAIGVGLAGIAIIILGHLVTTSGEHARAVARALVTAMVAGDRVGSVRLFANDAVLSIGSSRNPGLDHDFIVDAIDRWASSYKVTSNSISTMRGYTEAADMGEARMACMTEVNDFPYPNVSQWAVRARRQADGQWKIVQLTCVSINGQTPPVERLR